MKKYFTIYNNCIFVIGKVRSTINDLHRGVIQAVPNDLSMIFKKNNIVNVDSKLLEFKTEFDKNIFIEYLEFLEEEGFGFYSQTLPIKMPNSINTEFNHPSLITNCIIDIKIFNGLLIAKTINQINLLNIRNVEIRVFDTNFDKENFKQLSEVIDSTQILSVTIILPFDKFDHKTIEKLNKFRFTKIIFFNANEEKFDENDGIIIYTKKKNIDEKCCGVVHDKYFTLNIPTFTESLNHNSCLNRKISIDADGNIKNCPSMQESFGNIKDTTLAEAIEKPGFKKYWDINKDKIHVCKDCEFRYVCTDCRAYVEDPEDILSKPLKCGYNPYTGEWSDWSTNPLKQKAIDFYGMREIVEKEK